MRTKELSHDYRYFPEPDLEPLDLDAASLERIREGLPESPAERVERFVAEYRLPAYDAGVLTATRPLADWFEAAVAAFDDPKEVSNWVMGEVLRLANERGEPVRLVPEPRPLAPAALAELLALKAAGTISGSAAKDVLTAIVETGRSAAEVALILGLPHHHDPGDARHPGLRRGRLCWPRPACPGAGRGRRPAAVWSRAAARPSDRFSPVCC